MKYVTVVFTYQSNSTLDLGKAYIDNNEEMVIQLFAFVALNFINDR